MSPNNNKTADYNLQLSYVQFFLQKWNDKQMVDDLSTHSEKLGVQYPNMYPLQAINQVSFNPNRQAYLYHASGYQAGFVRLFCFEFLKE